MRLALVALALVGTSVSTLAVAAPAPFMFDDIQDVDPAIEEEKWGASAEFGYLMRSGNTDSTSYKVKLDLSRDSQKWRHRSTIDYYRAERDLDGGGTAVDADRFFASLQSNRRIGDSKNSSFFLYGSYEDDRLNSYDYQATLAAGYGARYRYNDSVYADFEIGPGMSYRKLAATGESDSDAILRLATNIDWTLSETSKFTQLISTEISEDNTRSRAVSALTANLNSRLAMRLSLTLTHNSTVTPLASGQLPEKLDTETAVTLVYTF